MADEVLLIRLLSLRFWPHFVPLVVSLAMLGFGAAGVALALLRHPLGRAPRAALAWTAIATAASFDLAFRASQRVPLDPFLLLWEPSAWPPFALFLALLALPFLLSGAATGLPLAFPMGRPGQVYAASFLGSAAGALLSEGALALLPTESLLRLPSALGALAALPLVLDPPGRLRPARAAALLAAALLAVAPSPPLVLSPYKDLAVLSRLPGAEVLARRSGLHGDYRALAAAGIHQAPGLSLAFRGQIPPQAVVLADGEGAGVVPAAGGTAPAYLAFLPSALPYRLLPPRASVLQLGLRGTEGILAAAAGGAAWVTVVEPARELSALVEQDLAGFSGGWPPGVRVEIRAQSPRAFLAREGRRFDLVELADVSSATFASLGVHAAGETFLLTVEGLRAALDRAGERGLVAFTGWLKAPPRESVKMLRTVRAALEAEGRPAADRVILVRGWGTFAAVARRTPFGEAERERARGFCEEMGFDLVWPPAAGGAPAGTGAAGSGAAGSEAAGRGEPDAARAAVPGRLPAGDERALAAAVAEALAGGGAGGSRLFDLEPAVDDSPYFHRFLRPAAFPEFRRALGRAWVPFVEWGVVFLLLSLPASLAVAALALVVPAFARRGGRASVRTLGYFASLGLAYMLLELVFLKAGMLFLGGPAAAAAAMGGFTCFSGLGSALSHRLASGRALRRACAAAAALGLLGLLLLQAGSPWLLTLPPVARLALFLLSLAPAAAAMGVPFPVGLSRLGGEPAAIARALAVNGFFSVAGATLASVGALWLGFRLTAAAGAGLYLLAGWLAPRAAAAGPPLTAPCAR
ncbi:MAG TPA: hypothetical protein VFF02_18145 [Anaeromyxobacteraceae bacterium]|nr:hypothetical protein [Anaeromyxobacteraceae bacterium]